MINDNIGFRDALSVNAEANKLVGVGRYDEASEKLIESLKVFFHFHDNHLLLLECLWKRNLFDECFYLLEKINAGFPEYKLQHEAIMYKYLLSQGKTTEANQKIKKIASHIGFPPICSLSGKDVLIVQDSNITIHDGDIMMLLSMTSLLADSGCSIEVELSKQFEGIYLVDSRIRIVKQGSGDIFRTRLSFFHLYLHISELLPKHRHQSHLALESRYLMKWEKLIRKEKKPLIGLCWHGDESHADTDRFVHLKFFAELLGGEFDVVSLQLSMVEKYLDHGAQSKLIVPTENINSWGDTAALVKSLDAVLTVDTAIAHLTAGLGIPVYVLLPEYLNFRWLHGSDAIYPKAHLYRKHQNEEWGHVVARAVSDLRHSFVTT